MSKNKILKTPPIITELPESVKQRVKARDEAVKEELKKLLDEELEGEKPGAPWLHRLKIAERIIVIVSREVIPFAEQLIGPGNGSVKKNVVKDKLIWALQYVELRFDLIPDKFERVFWWWLDRLFDKKLEVIFRTEFKPLGGY